MGNKVCQQFHHEQVVCPPKLRENVFTTAAVDNIDHNPSSTTAKESFHVTAISIFQHLSFAGEGLSRDIVIVAGSGNASSRTLDHLPHYYTEVPAVATSMKKPSVPEARMVSLGRDGFKRQTEEEYLWLDNARQVVEDPDLMSLKPPALFLMEQPSFRCWNQLQPRTLLSMLEILSSSWTGSDLRTREGACTADVPCTDWMRHCVQFCRAW